MLFSNTSQSCSASKHKVGQYFVDTTSLDNFLQPIYECREIVDILVVDEIGKMELKSDLFNNFISGLIGSSEKDKFSDRIIIATVPIVKSIPIVEKMKSLRNSKLFTVTKLNRSGIYDDIKTTVSSYVSELRSKN